MTFILTGFKQLLRGTVKLGEGTLDDVSGITGLTSGATSFGAKGVRKLGDLIGGTKQCGCLTKKTGRCSRPAEKGSSYCWQHIDCQKIYEEPAKAHDEPEKPFKLHGERPFKPHEEPAKPVKRPERPQENPNKKPSNFLGNFYESQQKLLCGMHALNNLIQNSQKTTFSYILRWEPAIDTIFFRENGITYYNLHQFCIYLQASAIRDERGKSYVQCVKSGNFQFDFILIFTSRFFDRSQAYFVTSTEEFQILPLRNTIGYICNLSESHYTAIIKVGGGWQEIDSIRNSASDVYSTMQEMFDYMTEERGLYAIVRIGVLPPMAIEVT